MLSQTAGGRVPSINPRRLEDLTRHGSYFSERQVNVLGELGAYITEHGTLPTTEGLAAHAGRSEHDVRNDLHQISLEGFLWVFGVEA